MSEGGEKTEQATPKREREARAKGQVARSQEVVTTISLFGVLATIVAFADALWVRLVTLMDTVAELAASGGPGALQRGIASAWSLGIAAVLPIVGVTILLAIAANYIQVGTLFSLEAVSPKLEKISIGKGFKRIFSMKQVVELLKSVLKIVFLSILLYYVVLNAIGPYVVAIDCGLLCIRTVTGAVLMQVIAYSAAAFVIVAGLDYMYQRHTHNKSLMMSKDEVKREYKESEGDPMIKGQRKQLAHELAMGDGQKQARSASALVVNPTHLAVAIRYREGQTPLPLVTAKGRGPEAQMLRVAAEQAGVPVFRNVTLARALFADAPVGSYVPDELFGIVAEILAWVGRHEHELYDGPARRGDIDMEQGDHRDA